MPIRPVDGDLERIYKKFSYGSSLDVFRLDMRSYRAIDSPNRQTRQRLSRVGRRAISFLEGRAAHVTPLENVHRRVEAGALIGIKKPLIMEHASQQLRRCHLIFSRVGVTYSCHRDKVY